MGRKHFLWLWVCLALWLALANGMQVEVPTSVPSWTYILRGLVCFCSSFCSSVILGEEFLDNLCSYSLGLICAHVKHSHWTKPVKVNWLPGDLQIQENMCTHVGNQLDWRSVGGMCLRWKLMETLGLSLPFGPQMSSKGSQSTELGMEWNMPATEINTLAFSNSLHQVCLILPFLAFPRSEATPFAVAVPEWSCHQPIVPWACTPRVPLSLPQCTECGSHSQYHCL